MSNFFETYLAAVAGIISFYALEALYYDIKARIRGKQYERFLEDLEEEYQE
jgi:hypothetical protein